MRFLLERIEKPLSEQTHVELVASIRSQIQRLIEGHRLAKDKGAVDLFSLELGSSSGLGPVVDLGANAAAEHVRYASDIEKLIRRYEPRLQSPKVGVVYSGNSSQTPRLVIQAQLRQRGKSEEFYFSEEVEST